MPVSQARGTSFSTGLVSGIVARALQQQLVTATHNATEVEGIRTWIKTNASRVGTAPLDHPWTADFRAPRAGAEGPERELMGH